MDCSLPGSSVHGIFQARILDWVAISFSRGSSSPRHQTEVSCIAGGFFTNWATREAQLLHAGHNFKVHVYWFTRSLTQPYEMGIKMVSFPDEKSEIQKLSNLPVVPQLLRGSRTQHSGPLSSTAMAKHHLKSRFHGITSPIRNWLKLSSLHSLPSPGPCISCSTSQSRD